MDNLPPATEGPDDMPAGIPAGFWVRAGACSMDILLIGFALIAINIALALVGLPPVRKEAACILLSIGYFSLMPAARGGQTFGKMAAGIAVIRTDGSPTTFLRCLARWSGYVISIATIGGGFFMAGFTRDKRALHDYLADTRVIFIHEISPLRRNLVSIVPFAFLFSGVVTAFFLPISVGPSLKDANKDNLEALQAAVWSYFNDNPGNCPTKLSDLAPKYVAKIPLLRLKGHPDSAEEVAYDGSVCLRYGVNPAQLKDTGRWGYISDPRASCYCKVFVDCTHMSPRHKPWAVE